MAKSCSGLLNEEQKAFKSSGKNPLAVWFMIFLKSGISFPLFHLQKTFFSTENY